MAASRLPGTGRRRPAILVGMGETAGYCVRLVEGLRAVGTRADHLNLGTDPMQYQPASPPRFVRMLRWLAVRRRAGPGPRAAWAALHRAGMLWLFIASVTRYDAFVFRAGDSFFALRDLGLLRRLGKPVIVIFFGSDSRPSYLNGAEINAQHGEQLATTTAAKRRMVARIEREASHVVCHVMSAQLHRRPAVRFLELGIPRPVGPPAPPPGHRRGRVRFLHAPSRAIDKGTVLVEEAVAEVRAAGLEVDLRLVSGRPNREVLAAIRDCDVVVDQLYSDTPMAALAAEAAALGRPAIVAGYGWDVLRAAGHTGGLPPAHLCRPDELAGAIRLLATDADYRADLGRRAHDFVAGHWTPERVAERIMRLLDGSAPSAWWFDPTEVAYVHGAGASEEAIGRAVRAVLDSAGPEGLQLSGRPELERRVLALAGRVRAA